MPSLHQRNVARYHAGTAQHGGHDMYLFHRDWHQQNLDPRPPSRPQRDWGMNLQYGTDFLQMHHEMVRAQANEPHQFMHHQSVVAWYQDASIPLSVPWSELQPIPPELGYEPDASVYPTEIRRAVEEAARRRSMTPERYLTRNTDTPAFRLPDYFTLEGVPENGDAEPLTGARKLADFKNLNQLGCCIIFPHNQWHGTIGGAMGSTWTAIADPIFYFGVHWHIDRVFDDYRALEARRAMSPRALPRDVPADVIPSDNIQIAAKFTANQRAWVQQQQALSKRLHAP